MDRVRDKPGRGEALLKYKNPPVVEVVLSVAFEPVQGLRLIHIGDLWREHFSDLSVVEEKSPIEMPLELFNGSVVPTLSFRMTPELPFPRLWFQNESRTQLVQLQNNFLARNWRKSDQTAEYPRYEKLRELFLRDLEGLNTFLSEKKLGPLVPTQCEITHINHVSASRVAEVVTFVCDDDSPPFGQPESTNIITQFLIKADDPEAVPLGRLHVQATTARLQASGDPVVVLTITARGGPMEPGINGILRFLDVARESSRQVFETMTRADRRAEWEEIYASNAG